MFGASRTTSARLPPSLAMLRWAETLVQLHQNKRLALLLAEARHLVETRIMQNIHAAALRLGRLKITHYCSRRCSGRNLRRLSSPWSPSFRSGDCPDADLPKVGHLPVSCNFFAASGQHMKRSAICRPPPAAVSGLLRRRRTPKCADQLLRIHRFAYTGPIPLIIPEARYFSIPSAVVGGAERRKSARN